MAPSPVPSAHGSPPTRREWTALAVFMAGSFMAAAAIGPLAGGALLSAMGFGALVFAIVEGPELGWWTPQTDMTIGGWTWSQDAAVSAVPVALAVAAVGEFAIMFVLPLYLINALGLDVMGAGLVLAAMAVGVFLSGAAARQIGSALGTAFAGAALSVALGLTLPASLESAGLTGEAGQSLADATRWAPLLAAVFLALGFIGALRVRRAAAVPAF